MGRVMWPISMKSQEKLLPFLRYNDRGIASSSGSPTAPNEAAVAPYDALTSPKLAELTGSSFFRHDAAPGSAANQFGMARLTEMSGEP